MTIRRVFIAISIVAAVGAGSRIFGLAQADTRAQIQLHYDQAQAALKADQIDKAADEFRQILRLDAKSSSAHANLGMIEFRHGEYAQAVKSFGEAVKLNPSLWDAQAFLGLSHARLGHAAEAKPLLEQALPHVQNPTLRIQAGLDLVRLAQESNRLDNAVNAIRELERLSPGDPEVLYAAYRVYSDLAARSVAALAKTGPGSARMHHILAQAALTQDDPAGAIAEYRNALKIEPNLPGIHYELGRALLQLSQEESARQEAQSEFEAELAANPSDAHAEYELGQLYSFRSNNELALKHYSRSLELQPNLVDAHLALGKLLSSAGRLDDAFSHFQAAARLDPNSEVAHYRLAQSYSKAGRIEDAYREREIFQKLRNARPASHSVHKPGAPPPPPSPEDEREK